MNKLLKVVIATLGGIEAVFSIGIPILISIMWVRLGGVEGYSSYVFLSAGILASLFRAIKIGILKYKW